MKRPNISLLSRINAAYPERKIHFLHKLNQEWEGRKPLQGCRILHNLVNSFETLHKLETLLRGGAELTVTKVDLVETPYRREVEAILAECGIHYVPDYTKLKGEFDIGMDCAARFLVIPTITFKVGVVELTQSGTLLYRKANTPYPVISVDDSHLKNLECMYGTGEAFVRAFIERTGQEISGQKFLVFGYGKIGQGIVKYLSSSTQEIIIIEKSSEALALAKKRGFQTIAASAKSAIKNAAEQAYGIVTATGVPGLLSRYLSDSEVGQAYLANMGAEDEIGDAFQSYPRILYNRAPINFSLKHPTRMKYLDPIFYAHNLTGETLIKQKLPAGYHAFDPDLDRKIIEEWVNVHGENVDDIWQ